MILSEIVYNMEFYSVALLYVFESQYTLLAENFESMGHVLFERSEKKEKKIEKKVTLDYLTGRKKN